MNIFTGKNIYNIFPIVAFLLVVGIFFSPYFLHGKVPVPSDTLVGLYHPWRDVYAEQYPRGIPYKNFLITDPIRQQIPWRKIGIDDLKNGEIPLWNPYSFAGTPLVGNIQSGLLYPFNIIFWILPFLQGWTFIIILQPVLSGIFLYVYLRSKLMHASGALIAAISWSFSGFSISWMTWGTIVHTALWLPLFLLCIDRIVCNEQKRITFLWSILLGVSMACSFLAGHVQVFLYICLCSIIYTLFQLKNIKRLKTSVITSFILSLFIFGCITFFQWKEFISLLQLSSRATEENLMNKEGWFIPLQHLVQFIIPDFFGNPATLNYWGTWNYGELTGYIGIIPLLFSSVAVLYSKVKEKYFWLGVLIVSLILSLQTPIATLPYVLNIPILATLQPTRLLVLVVFSLCVLSGYGFELVFYTEHKRLSHFFISSLIIFMVFVIALSTGFLFSKYSQILDIQSHIQIALRNAVLPFSIFLLSIPIVFFGVRKNTRKLSLTVLIILISFDMIRFGQKFTPFTDSSYFFPASKIISYLQSIPKPFRVLASDDRILPPNTAAYYGIEMVSGYDPLYSKYYEGLIAAHNRGKADLQKPYGFNRIITPTGHTSPVFDVLGIQYVVTYGPTENSQFEYVMNEGNTYLYKNPTVLPRFFFVRRVVSVENFKKAVETLFSFQDVSHNAVIQSSDTFSDSLDSLHDTISIKGYKDSSILLETKSDTDRFMVVSISYFPQWKAFVDGKSVTLYQTDGSFMGIAVPSGIHSIQLHYE